MSPEEPRSDEDVIASWLANADDALRAGREEGLPSGGDGTTPFFKQLQQDLAYVQKVRQVMRGRPEATPSPLTLRELTKGLAGTALGRFQIRRQLGGGGFGMVYLAYDPQLRRDVALKVPRPEILITPELRERFRREARAAAGLQHPNLVPLYEVGEIGPICFLVSAYCPGPTLRAWLKERREPVPWRAAATLLASLADAVHYAHCRGVVHRDLKPANILLVSGAVARGEYSAGDRASGRTKQESAGSKPEGPEATIQQPMIADFGLAKQIEGARSADDKTLTQMGVVVGTANYMAPEQASGKSRDVGPAADIYALGTILYELLTGRPPFQGESDLDTLIQVQVEEPIAPSRLRPRVPRDLETICLKCLVKEPARRYGSAAALADDLRHFLAGEPIRARAAGHVERLARWCKRKPALAAAYGLAAVAFVAAAGFAVIYSISQQTETARKQTEQQRALAQKYYSALAVEKGLAFCEQDDAARGLHWLARGLELAPADSQTTIRENLGAWLHAVHPLQAVLAHQGPVLVLNVSPDGKSVLTGGADNSARLWDLQTGTQLFHFPHQGKVKGAAFSRDGHMVATGGADRVVQIWSTATGERLRTLLHDGAVTWTSFSPTEDLLSVTVEGRYVQLWDPVSGRQRGQLKHEALSNLTPLLSWFSPDGKTIMTGDYDGWAYLWDAATAKRLATLSHEGSAVIWPAWASDGKTLATSGEDKVWLWDITGKSLGIIDHPARVGALAFSPKGPWLLSGCRDGYARVWDVTKRILIGRPMQHPANVRAVAFSPDGRQVLTASDDGTARLWDAATGVPHGMPLQHSGRIYFVRFSPDGKHLLTGSFDGTVRIWGVSTGKPPYISLQHSKAVRALTFSPDNGTAVTTGDDGIVRLWETGSGRLKKQFSGHTGTVVAVAFSPDGNMIATGSVDRTAFLWTLAGQRKGPFRHGDFVWSVAFSSDSRILATAAYDGIVQLWDTANAQLLRRQPMRHHEAINHLAFNPDGNLLVTSGEEGKVKIWRTATGELVAEMQHTSHVNVARFSPDGDWILSGSDDKTARLWQWRTGEQQVLKHDGAIEDAAFSPDGRWAATAAHDATAQLWDVATGQPIGERLTHQGPVQALAFSPNGLRLVTAGLDARARVWDLTNAVPQGGVALRHDAPLNAVAYSPDGSTILTGCRDGTARLWPAPALLSGNVNRISLWVQVVTGMELDAANYFRVLDAETWHQRRQGLVDLGGSPLADSRR
jgi:eukaryotic-like serine/threonine-protein kinase